MSVDVLNIIPGMEEAMTRAVIGAGVEIIGQKAVKKRDFVWILEPAHIRIASKIMASTITERKIESSLS